MRCQMIGTTSRTPVHGHVEDGWGKVADVFRANFEGNPGEVGAACCVYVGGRAVVDRWGGLADRKENRPWDNTIVAWIGLPEEQEPRVARLEYAAPFTMEEMTAGMIETTGLDKDTVIAWMSAVWGPDSVQARAGMLGGALDPSSGYMNTRAWRAAEFPCCNMFADARSLARMYYAATVSEVDEVRLLNPAHRCPGRGHAPSDTPAPADRSHSVIPMPLSASAT